MNMASGAAILSPSLRQMLRQMERMLRGSQDGLVCVDRNLRYVYWSGVMETISGLPAEEVLGRHVLEVFPFLEASGGSLHFQEALAGGSVQATEQSFSIPETGREGYYNASYAPLEDSEGRIVGASGIIRDITELRRANALIRETETRFKTMADSAPVLLWMARTDSLCTFFNHTWLDFTGRTLEEEWGVGWAEGVHHEDFQPAMDTYMAAFNQRADFEMEYRLRRADGEFRWILDRGTPRYSPEGAFAGYIGSCVDITDRRTIEQQLREAVRARDEFLSIASHELKTPLTSLHLQLQTFEHIITSDASTSTVVGRGRKVVEVANRQIGRMTGLIEMLLDVSRIHGGKLAFQFADVDLTTLVSETVERLTEQITRAGCQVELSLQPGIVGHWDKDRLDQVLVNLIMNATRYAAGTLVAISTSGDQDHAVITVRDHGPGIAEAELSMIFNQFHRSASSSHFGGLGLGLYIVRHIVETHHGTVHVESTPGHGATFHVDLPLCPPT